MAANETTMTQTSAAQSAATQQRGKKNINVGETERYASALGGGALALYGLTRGSLGGIILGLIGGALVYRGVTGHCDLYEAAGINTSHAGKNPRVSVPGNQGIKVEETITINRSPEDLYKFWRNFENLPKFMNHLEAVRATDPLRSHWVAKAPAGMSVEWDAEVINDKENELIAWRSLEGADVDNAGSVRFAPRADGRGTDVRVALEYNPPGGKLGAFVARLFGEEPQQQVADDLQRFKQVMEAGESKAENQTSGRTAQAGGNA